MENRPVSQSGFWLAAGAVAATYGYFLLFAEFAFLGLVRAGTPDGPGMQAVMGALGTGGIAGSLAALWRFGPEKFVRRLVWSYAACAGVAACAPFATGRGAFVLVAAGIGLALGWNTVTLAAGLKGLLPAGRLGLGAGLGTGVAYALCNVPAVFSAPAPVQTWISVVTVAVAALALRRARPDWRGSSSVGRPVVWPWVGAFLVLVCGDSAAFHVIQQTPALREAAWSGAVRLWANALVHLGVALAAGWLLDRGCLRGTVAAAGLGLAVAGLGFGAIAPVPSPGLLYSGAVSLYSAALVYFAARDGRPRIAAVVFAVAGWAGSALGLGLAQGLLGMP